MSFLARHTAWLVMKVLWLVVVLVKQLVLQVGVVGLIVYVGYVQERERESVRERERTCRGDVWLVV